MVDRILVVGCPASGKSTFAARLAHGLNVPLVNLDELWFGPGWSAPDPVQSARRVDDFIAAPRWVIDGNHQSTFERRLAAADCVVSFDRPPPYCALSYLRRAARLKVAAWRGADQMDFPSYMCLPDGKIRVTSRPVRFVLFILRFGEVRREMDASLAGFNGRVIRIKSFDEADQVITELVAKRQTR
jgi:hypothetical protein